MEILLIVVLSVIPLVLVATIYLMVRNNYVAGFLIELNRDGYLDHINEPEEIQKVYNKVLFSIRSLKKEYWINKI